MNVLIVDDSIVMRKIIRKSLGETAYGVAEFTEAQDGMDALNKCTASLPDLILCDWNMPNMNGIDFVMRLRQMKTKKRPVIIMVTTEGTMVKMEEAMKQGVDSYVVKPFTPQDLERVISKALDQQAKG